MRDGRAGRRERTSSCGSEGSMLGIEQAGRVLRFSRVQRHARRDKRRILPESPPRPPLRPVVPPLRAARDVPRPRARGEPRLLVQAGAAVRRRGGARSSSSGSRRACTAPTRAGGPFTGDYAGILLYETLHRVRLRVEPAGRRPRAATGLTLHRLPDHQRGEVPAAAEQAAAGRDRATATAISRRIWRRCRAGGAILALGRIAHDATLRALGLKRAALRVRARRAASRSPAPASRCSTAITAAATTPTRGRLTRGDVPRGLRRRSPRISARRRAPGRA